MEITLAMGGGGVVLSYCPNCPKIQRVLKLVSSLVDKFFTICVSKKLLKGNLVKVPPVRFFLGNKNYTILLRKFGKLKL